jgi:hypothetical protein
LVTIDDAERAHQAWLASDVATLFNESAYYPYTSLKYHVLLTAALCDAYTRGAAFADLWLAVDDGAGSSAAGAAGGVAADADASSDGIRPHRTVLATDAVALSITADPGDRPAARLGDRPARSFADVWARLPAHPLATGDSRRAMILDAQLRRIRSWSTALQYIEDYTDVAGRLGGRAWLGGDAE